MNNHQYQICTKTIMDISYPNIVFTERRESDHYANYIENIVLNCYIDKGGYEELMKIEDKIKRIAAIMTLNV